MEDEMQVMTLLSKKLAWISNKTQHTGLFPTTSHLTRNYTDKNKTPERNRRCLRTTG